MRTETSGIRRLVLDSKGIGVLTVMVQFEGKITQDFLRENAIGIIFRKKTGPPVNVLPAVLGCRVK